MEQDNQETTPARWPSGWPLGLIYCSDLAVAGQITFRPVDLATREIFVCPTTVAG